MLLAFLRATVHDRDAVDDLFQETMVTAWKRFDDYDLERPFAAWLRGIARRLILAHLRRRANDRVYSSESLLDHLESRMVRLDEIEADTWAEKVRMVERCLEKLPSPMREAIDSHYRDALSTAEIAAKTETTAEAIKKRLQRGRALLARCLVSSGLVPGRST